MAQNTSGTNNDTDTFLVIARLNDRAQPLDRGELYEDPLDHLLKQANLGQVTGGGTQLAENGEIEFCEIEIELNDVSEETLNSLKAIFEKLGAPKSSKMFIGSQQKEIPFGELQGLAVYLNGTDLPESTYQECDVNFVFSEFDRLLEGEGSIHSYWEGPTETALYMYGNSFETMRDLISDFLDTYPLCEKARVVQIA